MLALERACEDLDDPRACESYLLKRSRAVLYQVPSEDRSDAR